MVESSIFFSSFANALLPNFGWGHNISHQNTHNISHQNIHNIWHQNTHDISHQNIHNIYHVPIAFLFLLRCFDISNTSIASVSRFRKGVVWYHFFWKALLNPLPVLHNLISHSNNSSQNTKIKSDTCNEQFFPKY